MSAISLIDLPEIGLKVSVPKNWGIRYDANNDIIILRENNNSMGIYISRSISSESELTKRLLSSINCKRLVGNICEINGKMIKVERVDYSNALVLYYYDQKAYNAQELIRDIINSMEVMKPKLGLFVDRIRVNEEKFRWSVTIPRTWEISPYGLFKSGFIASSGTTFVWVTFYPFIHLFNIGKLLEERSRKILSEIMHVHVFKSKKGEHHIEVDFNRGPIKYELFLQAKPYLVDIDGIKNYFIVETGWIVPMFLKQSLEGVINEILTSYSIGPNFMQELRHSNKYEYYLYAIAILSRFIGKNLNEIFQKYLKEVDKELIDEFKKDIMKIPKKEE